MSTIERKADARALEAFIKNDLSKLSGLDISRRWWTQFAFHFTDINNAVNILTDGRVYSRNQLKVKRIQFVDGASPSVINKTGLTEQDSVRLYFRPHTPTQYDNEGIRPVDKYVLGAHMPVPIFLLFDLVDTLTRKDCTFSDQSVAKSMFSAGGDSNFLRQLPFNGIYHDTYLPDDLRLKSEIKAQRHAEILIPRELDIMGLREIHCRSKAEKDTLLHLLPSHIREQWQDNIFSDSRGQVFYKKWTYVDTVTLANNRIVIRFSPETRTSGPFKFKFKLDIPGQFPIVREQEQFHANKAVAIELKQVLTRYTLSLTLDNHLIYENAFEDYNVPF